MTLLTREADIQERVVLMGPAPTSTASRQRFVFTATCAAVALAAIFSLASRDPSLGRAVAKSDFRAFYCAGYAARDGDDPYRAAPLAACERTRVGPPAGVRFDPATPDPAPLPPYAIAVLEPLSGLPFLAAAVIWWSALVLAIAATALIVARLTGLALPVVVVALTGTEIVACIAFGQIGPFATLAIAATARLLAAGNDVRAALWACVALVQPQAGLPVLLSLILWRPRTRLPIALAALALSALSLVTLGFGGNREYVASVLPAQAIAQAPLDVQYSLTWLLYFFGVSEHAALQLASVQYALTAAFAVLLAASVARGLRAPAAIALFPAAASLVGGSYIHFFQMGAAVPFALLLANRTDRWRPIGGAAAILLAAPWGVPNAGFLQLVCAAGCACAAYFVLADCRTVPRVGVPIACAALIALTPLALERISDHPIRAASPRAFAAEGTNPALASSALGARIRQLPAANQASWRTFAVKVPTWFAILMLGSAAFAGAAPLSVRVAQTVRATT